MSEQYSTDDNLSLAWARAIRQMTVRGGPGEIAPVVVSVTGFKEGEAIEDLSIRKTLDHLLADMGLQDSHAVANTIFPASYWNPATPRQALFDRYTMALPRIRRACKKNSHGMYFERMISGGPETHPNQLDFIIGNYASGSVVRRSALQVGIFDPKRDQTGSALAGFPCLQHVTFAPVTIGEKKKGLCINGFYASQYAFERAYGNYLGLCRLGRFVAHELSMPLVRMTCFTGIMLRDEKGLTLDRLQPLAKLIDKRLGKDGKTS